MAVTVNFYTASKAKNSTKVPSGAAASYACNVRDGCGVLHPVLELVDSGNTLNPSAWNMAGIPTYGRYYWIKECEYRNHKWIIYLDVDPLSTYKSEIGSLSRYILRSASEQDPNITDNLMVRKAIPRFSITSSTTGLISPAEMTNGMFVVGVLNNAASGGMVSYYALTYGQMQAFKNFMMSMDADDSAFDWDTFGEAEDESSGSGSGSGTASTAPKAVTLTAGMVKALLDPIKYVVSCMWFPVIFLGGGSDTINFGFWETPFTGTLLGTDTIYTSTRSISAPTRHDESTMPGMYCKCEPFAQMYLIFPPFGAVQIPVNETAFSGINTRLIVDYVTGQGILQVFAGSGQTTLLCQESAQIGVPFQLSQITTDYTSIASGGFQGVIKSAAALGADLGTWITENILGKDTVYAAKNPGGVTSGYLSDVKIAGSSGGMAGLYVGTTAYLVLRYLQITDSDIANIGQPLCKVKTLNTQSGYVQCRAGKTEIAGACEEELAIIEACLEGGFYYE